MNRLCSTLPTYVPIQDAARQEGMSRAAIYRLIRLGHLDKYRPKGFDRRTHIDIDRLRELRRNPPMERIE